MKCEFCELKDNGTNSGIDEGKIIPNHNKVKFSILRNALINMVLKKGFFLFVDGETEFSGDEIDQAIEINYCPMCGRKLED